MTAHTARDDIAPSAWAFAYLRYRKDCFCGEPKGHVGWLLCAAEATSEAKKAARDQLL